MPTEYSIDIRLYEEALKQIKASYIKQHPVSPTIADTVLPAIDEHAKHLFGLAWQGAVDGHESNKRNRAKMLRQQLRPLDEKRLAELDPRSQQKMRERHAELEKRMHDRMADVYKHMDDHNRRMFIALFTNSGVEEDTAMKILDEYILIHT